MKWKAVEWKTLYNSKQPWTSGAHIEYYPTVQKSSVVLVFAVTTGSSCSLHIDLGCMFLRHPVSMPRREYPKRVHFALVCKSTFLPTRWRERDRQFVAGESSAEFCESLQDGYPALKDACHWNFPANSLLAICLHHRVLQATSSKSRFSQLVHLTAWLRVVSEEHLWLQDKVVVQLRFSTQPYLLEGMLVDNLRFYIP